MNSGMSDLVRLTVHGVFTDQNTEAQVVVLRSDREEEVLPIWIGPAEGDAIKRGLDGAPSARPMTHDLLRSLTQHFGVRVAGVVITEVKNNTYYASIQLVCQGTESTVDSRPSDAIALALRTGSPIYATREVLQERGGGPLDAWLEKLGAKQPSKFEG